MSGTEKGGLLSGLLGLFILAMMVYTPVYFFILNDEIDEVQEISLKEAILASEGKYFIENRELVEDSGKGLADKLYEWVVIKFFWEDPLEKEADKLADALRIDIGKSLEDALEDNDNISNISFSRGSLLPSLISPIPAVRVSVKFTVKDIGVVKLNAFVQTRSFFKFRLCEFIGFEDVVVKGERYYDPIKFLATVVYKH